jgi:hypothetical protein
LRQSRQRADVGPEPAATGFLSTTVAPQAPESYDATMSFLDELEPGAPGDQEEITGRLEAELKRSVSPIPVADRGAPIIAEK